MPYIETPDELAEWMADYKGVYEDSQGSPDEATGDHREDCECRMCFVDALTSRIRASVKNEEAISEQLRSHLAKIDSGYK